MTEAVDRNPNDWRLQYDLALLLAATGRDAAVEAQQAAQLNPLDSTVGNAARILSVGTPSSRQAFARSAPFLWP
jgi:Flp pilus assembly protein TadD